MDIQKIIDELRAERTQIEEAILSLERLAAAHGKRRGRPPKWLTEVKATVGSNHREAVKKSPGVGRATKPATAKRRAARRTVTAVAAPSVESDAQV